MTPQQAEDLVKSYKVISADVLQEHRRKLEKMRNFYEWKAPDAPETQRIMFRGFVNSLNFAIETTRQYRELTVKLAKLAEVDDVG